MTDYRPESEHRDAAESAYRAALRMVAEHDAGRAPNLAADLARLILRAERADYLDGIDAEREGQ